MINIDTNLIEEAVYNLCVRANTEYNSKLYNILTRMYNTASNREEKYRLYCILKNIQLASKSRRPLCQDTGQVMVFMEIGQNVHLSGGFINDAVNKAVEKAYKENFFRKSVAKDALFDRNNTGTNTPSIIYTDIEKGDEVKINILIKGAGSENYSNIKMFSPSTPKEEIYKFIKDTVANAGEKSCPPLVLGIGFGETMDGAAVLSKKAFFKQNETDKEAEFIKELKKYLGEINKEIIDIKILSEQTHIASLPCAITINCHSTRHAQCTINESGITYKENNEKYNEISDTEGTHPEIHTNDIEKIRTLKKGERVLLTGEIYTARDAAHKRINEYYKQTGNMPFDIKDKIIFYAGPCPAGKDEIIGPIGPTTSARMDRYCDLLYSNGLLATIGKGERSFEAQNAIESHRGRYFSAQGGIACLLSKCIKKSEIILYEELDTEAIRKLYVEKLPLKVEI